MTDGEIITWLKAENDQLKADRREWDAERRYLVDTVMALTGATSLVQRPDPEEKAVEELPVQAGPHRMSWNQVNLRLERESQKRVLEHRKALASAAQGGNHAAQ